jgi:hypothetical protein
MAHGRNKYQSRENRARVRDILMREWDPIGVADAPEASDEYDAYVGTVYVMLMDQRASKDEITAYLFDVAANHMGISAHERIAKCSARAAEFLIAMRPEFEIH